MTNILVVDTGTTSMRAILYDEHGNVLLHCQSGYKQLRYDQVGTAEQSGESFVQTMVSLLKELVSKADANKLSIDCLSLTAQRSSVIALDKNGDALTPFLMWHDKRTQDFCNELDKRCGVETYRISGMKITPILSAPKIHWFKKELSTAAPLKFLGVQDWLLLFLTGKYVTDLSFASRTGLLDVEHGMWSDPLLRLYGVSEDELCMLIPPGSKVGGVSPSAADMTGLQEGLPVISAGGDQQCSVLGQGSSYAKSYSINSGTASYLSVMSDHCIFDAERRINLNCSAVAGMWVAEASTLASGAVLEWVRKMFYDTDTAFSVINHDASASPVGSNGVIMLPDMAGRGCPEWNYNRTGLISGLTMGSRKGDIVRAALEGIASELSDCYNLMASMYGDFSEIRSTGGLSRSGLFNKILADTIGVRVTCTDQSETTSIGAWANAAGCIGIFPDARSAVSDFYMFHTTTEYLPDAAHHELYKRQQKKRMQLYQNT